MKIDREIVEQAVQSLEKATQMLAFMSKQDDKYTEAWEELRIVGLTPLIIALDKQNKRSRRSQRNHKDVMNKGKPTLKWDLDSGEGSIGNLDSFRQEFNTIMRLDLLQDWIHDLQEEYNETIGIEFSEDPRKKT